jgi:formylglycine-generating enzyme required for sulfatase activity
MRTLWHWTCLAASGLLLGCSSPVDEEGPADAASDAATDAQVVSPTAAPCPADMVAVAGFCMDRYEAPNKPGVAPLAMRTATDGVAYCAALGRRLCTEAEWVRACQGPAGLPYPYGTTYQHSRCDDDKTWKIPNWTTLGTWPSAAAMAEAQRLYQADESGKRTGCVSAEGVYDLTGNVAEWVVRSFPNSHNYDHVMKGCYWSGCYGGSPPSCAFVNPAHPGTFRTYEAGFRCCLTRS